ncbi:MAG: glycine-rich domain-containing protein, partial [Candidatus Saccharimonadales bacterium]
ATSDLQAVPKQQLDNATDGLVETVNHGADTTVARPAGADRVLWFGTVEPDNGATDDLLLRTDLNVLYRYDGTAWQEVGGGGVTDHGIEVFEASGTLTVPEGVMSIDAELVGGGGGGAGLDLARYTSGGGGAGGYSRATITVSPGDEWTVTIGSGASGGASSSSVAPSGGTTSFSDGSTTLQGTGGEGGGRANNSARGGPGGVGSGGDVNATGNQGGRGAREDPKDSGAIFAYPAGWGAGSQFGGGVQAPASGTGTSATSYGAGGSGARNTTGSTAQTGGAGEDGVVIVRW